MIDNESMIWYRVGPIHIYENVETGYTDCGIKLISTNLVALHFMAYRDTLQREYGLEFTLRLGNRLHKMGVTIG